MSAVPTEFEFVLPEGFVDPDGGLHRHGVMRLATDGDVQMAAKDYRVRQDPPYLAVIVLARVVLRLGRLEFISTRVIEDLAPADFDYLLALYRRINQADLID